MKNPNAQIAHLIGRHLDGTISESEVIELDNWATANDANRQFFDEITSDDYIQDELNKHYYYDVEAAWEKLVLRANIPFRRPGSVIKWRWLLSAAAVLLLVVFGWMYITPKSSKKSSVAPVEIAFKNDIQPGGDKAVLVLADGTVVELDSAGNGNLVKQGVTQIVKTADGSIEYTAEGKSKEVLFNTMSTPKGGKYRVILADGSKVWLNALSSIKYPTAFTGSERSVQITGEAFFEVAKDKSKPFFAHFTDADGKDAMVEVLGTEFDLNTYKDDGSVKTTLIEGKVRVTAADNQSKTIKPGEQVQLNASGQIKVESGLDTDEITAWKNGYFHFENATVEEILQTAARWYDITVKYDYKPVEGYRVRVERSMPISKLLEYVEAIGGVHFSIEGKTVTVRK